jgi:solute carrier family 32 (vesicular inhibitory amino acid transporter)
MDRDEEMGHGDRSLLFIGDEDDDLAVDRDGAYSSSSDEGDDGDVRDAPDEDDDESQQGEWPQSYRFAHRPSSRLPLPIIPRFACPCRRSRLLLSDPGVTFVARVHRRQSVDMRSVVPSPTMSSMSRFSSNLIKNGSSFFLKKGDTSLLPLTRPLLAPSQQSQPQLPPSPLSQQSQPQLPPSLSQLSQLLPPAVRESTDSSQPQSTLSQHGSGITERPSRVCLKSDYIELPPPANKCSMGQAIINGEFS